MVNTFDEELYMSGPITQWVSGEFMLSPIWLHLIRKFSADFTRRCLSAPKTDGLEKVPTLHTTCDLPIPTPLLSEWAKAALASGSWKDALVAAVGVSVSIYSGIPCGPDTRGSEFMAPRFIIYRAICERLEMTDCVLDASSCFHQMVSELAGQIDMHDVHAKWVLGELRTQCRRR